MNRRSLVLGIGLISLTGCTGSGQLEDWRSNPSNQTRPDDDNNTSDSKGDSGAILEARWVEESPEGIEPYPSDQPPVSDYDVVVDLLEKAASQEERTPTDDETPTTEVKAGEIVTEQISSAMENELRKEFSDLENQGGDEYPGRYFTRNGTIVVLRILGED